MSTSRPEHVHTSHIVSYFHNGPVGRVSFHLCAGRVAWFRPATFLARLPCPIHVFNNSNYLSATYSVVRR